MNLPFKCDEATKKKLLELFGQFGQEKLHQAQERPEACLHSLLNQLIEDNKRIGPDLRSTIRWATFTELIDKAEQELLKQKS